MSLPRTWLPWRGSVREGRPRRPLLITMTVSIASSFTIVSPSSKCDRVPPITRSSFTSSECPYKTINGSLDGTGGADVPALPFLLWNIPIAIRGKLSFRHLPAPLALLGQAHWDFHSPWILCSTISPLHEHFVTYFCEDNLDRCEAFLLYFHLSGICLFAPHGAPALL